VDLLPRGRTRAEFERFVASHGDRLLRTGYLVTWELAEAEDLVQECLLKVARRWPQVRTMAHPDAYARRILINLALDGARRRTRLRSELGQPDRPLLEPATEAQSLNGLAELGDRSELFDALGGLPQHQRLVLVLRYFADLSEAQTAEALNCSLGTVKSTTSRGLARLRSNGGSVHRPGSSKRSPGNLTRDKEKDLMIEQLESALREALRERADAMPAHAYARLRQVDYHPRSPERRKALALGGTLALASAAGIAVSVVGLGAGTQRAFAGWTSSPTAPASGQTTAAEAVCKADMATPAELERARQQATGRHPAPGEWPAGNGGEWRTVLTDTRGPYTIVLLANADGERKCLTGPGFAGPAVNGGEGASNSATVPSGQIGEPSYGFSRATDEQPYMETSGRVGSGVSAVTLVFSDRTHVAASIQNGWFLAWWPGSQSPVAAEVRTTTGMRIQPLNDPIRQTTLQLGAESGKAMTAGAARRPAFASGALLGGSVEVVYAVKSQS
jgi:RNA polymerase sigma-70 factor (sigma-E family)